MHISKLTLLAAVAGLAATPALAQKSKDTLRIAVNNPFAVLSGYHLPVDDAGAIYRVARADDRASAPKSAAAPRRANQAANPHLGTTASDPLAELDQETRSALRATGEALFTKHACGSCHLADQAGPGVVVKTIEGLQAKYSIKTLGDFFLAPQPPMPVFELSESDRRSLAVYLLSLEVQAMKN